ncbi:carboxylesterase/lipase family protein [Pseudarthrobacter phenanthrenivorans]|uniref:carboxylesterase/lipase family protein n=1 Tax=Pseudarthrobacter phenanthrenivorans TaxID=361575 RepID=UPI0011272543|nr:carboxylesterase/lipase family protein [Pseudarthrobacter phenanthrenivorans]TPV53488.1 carboxylesterase/lipase family protein [Pseudarthrobacter phenanthrenivorans]
MSLSRTVTIAEGRVRGTATVVERRGVSRFLGIPYAGSPVGSARFRPPVPAFGWAGVRDCTGPGPAAPQNPEVPAPPGRKPRTWSEDGCLNLNVWTPDACGSGLPVMVWIHGGAYVSGAGSDGMYDGGNLAGATGTVVVTVNYRLGALGFLHLGDLLGDGYADSSNVALLDVLEALRWVGRNIDAFGGDPGNVTLFGESAGAAAVGTLLGMPASEGLFRRAIMQSGTAERFRSAADSARLSREFLSLCEVGDARELLVLPVERLLEAQEKLVQQFGAETYAVPLPFQPAVGTPSLPLPPLEAVRAGMNSGVDLLVGTNLNEGSFAVEMRPKDPLDPPYAGRAAAVLRDFGAPGRLEEYAQAVALVLGAEASGKELLEAVVSDAVYRQPSNRLLDARHGSAGRTFSYLFTWRSPAMGGKLGACHALDIPFVFRQLGSPEAEFLTRGRAPQGLGDAMSSAWAAFARAGLPAAPGLPSWPDYRYGRQAMILDDVLRVEEDPRSELREFWADVLAASGSAAV